MAGTWIVLLEAAGYGAGGAIERDDVVGLLDTLDSDGGALHCPDRYALQVTTTAASPAEALFGVLSNWADAVRRLGLPCWEVVRTEVLTPDELERDFESCERDALPLGRSSLRTADSGGGDPGHDLLRRAFSDPLTGLLGREAFEHRVGAALGRVGSERHVAVLHLDLDAFGRFNDRFGAPAGDQLLVVVAQRLAAMLRPGDGLARFGSDGYAVVLEDTTEEAAVAVASRMLDAVGRPVTILDRDLSVSASAGVALSEAGQQADHLLGNAGTALAVAKKSGGGRHVLFRPAMPRPDPALPFVGTDAVQDRLAHLLLMQEVAVAANEADTLQQAAGVVMRQICAHIDCDIGHLRIPPADDNEAPSASLWHVAHGADYRAFQEATDRLSFLAAADLAARVSAAGRPVWIADLAAEADWGRREAALAAGLETAFAFPILVGAEVVGVLEFFSRIRMEPTGSFLDVLVGIGTQLGRVVERQRAVAALRRSADELRISEARLGEAQALAGLGSWHFDLRTGKSTWSEQMCSLSGLEPGAPAPDLDSALATVHPGDRARAREALSQLVESGERTAEDVRVVRADGEVRWHRVEGSVLRDEQGKLVAIYGTSQDITERKEAEEALRERESQLAAAQSVAGLGSWERDLSTNTVTWSEEMYRMWRWEPGREVSFEAFLATVQADDRRTLLERSDRLRQNGESTCFDFRASVADGEARWFRGAARLLHDEYGTPLKVVGTVQDVTAEKEVDEELRRVKELYERIIETTYEGVLMVDAQDITTFATPRMAEILGYAVDEMSGLPVSAFVDEETLAALSAHRQRRRAGISEHYGSALRAKDGTAVPVLISASPLFDGDCYTGALAMVTDVSALREAEEVLRLHDLEVQADRNGAANTPPAS